ncbi:hypothetical protein B0T18DRAFT_239557 [Schizothecium vesticola]|uniref:F-box domain-containing protein n=1 Tax=Schizothecium vesticola TaxID=314040 RepID=A0AA40EFN0_9PEZI|nr:hypothetical protein B0T18DRAFT_239557 [Schizothecium vesticola]
MTLNIVSLPEEIIFNIFTPLERNELCSLRLVCHRLHSTATQTLFSLVCLYASDESLARYNRIIQHPSFKTYVRHVELNTLTDKKNAIHDPRLHAFMAELRTTVLAPDCTANLRTLALYQTTFHFGFAPKLDLRGTHFPRLRTLALGRYTFTHAWQLEWLGGHGGTLEEVYFDDYIVIYYAKLMGCGVDGEGYPVFESPGGGRRRWGLVGGRIIIFGFMT